jgi:phage N-6-adenine-methyltransferase
MKDLVKIESNWYQQLIDDLRLLNFEGIVRTKHAIGKRILKDELKFERAEYGKKTIVNLAEDLGIDFGDIYRCIKFASKFPDIGRFDQNLSWEHIKRKLLPEKTHVSQSTGESEWNTPSEYIESARELMGKIDIDPASNKQAQEIIQAEVYYTQETDGLDKSWAGNVWMNPPYSQPLIKDFCNTLVEKYKTSEINQACVLVNNATETGFFQNMLKVCTAICFIKGRVKFIDKSGEATGAPLQGQVIIYFGKKLKKFKELFSRFGEILWKEEK